MEEEKNQSLSSIIESVRGYHIQKEESKRELEAIMDINIEEDELHIYETLLEIL